MTIQFHDHCHFVILVIVLLVQKVQPLKYPVLATQSNYNEQNIKAYAQQTLTDDHENVNIHG